GRACRAHRVCGRLPDRAGVRVLHGEDPMNTRFAAEPAIAVGLVQSVPTVAIRTTGPFLLDDGVELPEGEYQVTREGDEVVVQGPVAGRYRTWSVRPQD